MPNRIKLTVSYKGTHYHGWQKQPQSNTIQEILEEALYKITKEKINLVGTSRTDAGVHARGQICHFDWPGEIPESIQKDPQKLTLGINSLIPFDISIQKTEIVDRDFNSQRNVESKEYIYQILLSKIKDPFLQEYFWRIPYELDIEAMKKAAPYLIGHHNFKSFCASDTNVKTFDRTLMELEIQLIHQNQLQFKFKGDGFLKQMIRNIMGSLVEVGRKKQEPEWIKEILKTEDRTLAGACAPAKGLTLQKINFKN